MTFHLSDVVCCFSLSTNAFYLLQNLSLTFTFFSRLSLLINLSVCAHFFLPWLSSSVTSYAVSPSLTNAFHVPRSPYLTRTFLFPPLFPLINLSPSAAFVPHSRFVPPWLDPLHKLKLPTFQFWVTRVNAFPNGLSSSVGLLSTFASNSHIMGIRFCVFSSFFFPFYFYFSLLFFIYLFLYFFSFLPTFTLQVCPCILQ